MRSVGYWNLPGFEYFEIPSHAANQDRLALCYQAFRRSLDRVRYEPVIGLLSMRSMVDVTTDVLGNPASQAFVCAVRPSAIGVSYAFQSTTSGITVGQVQPEEHAQGCRFALPRAPDDGVFRALLALTTLEQDPGRTAPFLHIGRIEAAH